MSVEYLDIELMEKLCYRLAVELFHVHEEPIPPFEAHNLALLDSALSLPRQAFGGRELYPSLVDKAVVLYYGLIKNHPFINGNKRIATASLLVFLFMNDCWLDASKSEIVAKALQTAQSLPQERESLLGELRDWISTHIVSKGQRV